MIGFIKYIWENYRKHAELQKLQHRADEMVSDIKKLGKDKLIEKYGNPSAAWARLKWDIYRAKHGIPKNRKCTCVKTRNSRINKG
jgi:hypothetical protein